MKTINEILSLSTKFLENTKVEGARRISEDLLAHALKCKRMELYMQFDRPVIEVELNLYRDYIKRASKDEPVQYIIGEMDFYSAKIKVDPRALIPRQETEILVSMISKENPKGSLWDLCTGSGCIGIALKKKHPDLDVTLTDISQDALDLAKENAEKNNVDVQLAFGDLFEPLKGKKTDFIVCNPPYIRESEYKGLDASLKFEPKLALVSGKTGIEFYERLAKEISSFLNPNGKAYFEIGSTQGEVLKELFPTGRLENDWAGHPRFFTFLQNL